MINRPDNEEKNKIDEKFINALIYPGKKEMKEKLEKLEAEIELLKNKLENLENRLKELEDKVKELLK